MLAMLRVYLATLLFALGGCGSQALFAKRGTEPALESLVDVGQKIKALLRALERMAQMN